MKIIWIPPRPPPVYTQTFVIIKQKLIYLSKVIKRENWTHWLLYSGNLPAFSFVQLMSTQLIGPALERDSPEVSQLTMDIRANAKTWGQMNWDRTVSGHMVSRAQRWASTSPPPPWTLQPSIDRCVCLFKSCHESDLPQVQSNPCVGVAQWASREMGNTWGQNEVSEQQVFATSR